MSLKRMLALIAVLAVVYVAYQSVRMVRLVRIGKTIGSHTEAFQKKDGAISVLVIGDSTAFGQGAADPHNSTAGRLAALLDASVENRARSGALTEEGVNQIAGAQRNRYDLILIQIGANDAIRFRPVSATDRQLDVLLAAAARKSARVVLLTAGKIGEAPFFPRPFEFLWTWQAGRLRDRFSATAAKNGAEYVDLFSIPDPFSQDPSRFYAADGLHLSDDGYGFWFEQIQKTIQRRWPELMHGK